MIEVYRVNADSSRLLVCRCLTWPYAARVAELGIAQGLSSAYALREGEVESIVQSPLPVDNGSSQ